MRRIDYGYWIFRIITWDALLPALVILSPNVIKRCFPGNRGILEITAITLPVGLFLVRAAIGKRQIELNRCSARFRSWQFVAFFVGILPLVMIDCLMILSHLMPNGIVFLPPLGWVVVLGIYLTAMTIAMYPGRVAG